MEQFNFNGNWKYKINLEEFIESNLKWRENINSSNSIMLKIVDHKDYEPEPLEEQITTIQYIFNNEKLVLDALCKAFQVINKKYGDNCGEHDWYSNEMKFNDLGQIFLIREIEIFTEYKNGQAYYQLSGGYRGDYEHGLIVVMHKERLIAYNQIGEDGYKEIYEDLGESGMKFRTFNIEHQYFGANKVHMPLPKFKKLKPWQLNATGEYFDNLLREKENKKLIQEIESNNWNINLRFPYLGKNIIDKAAYKNNVEIIRYLLSKGVDSSQTLDECMHKGFFHKESINCLIENGVSINSLSNWGMTPLCHEIKNYINSTRSINNYKAGDIRIERVNKEMKNSIEKMRFYISLGAKHINIDTEGNDYKSFIINKWNKDFLVKNNIISKIEKLILPDSPTGSKWAFWR